MTAFHERGARVPDRAPGPLTAQRLLVAFLLAAVAFEGWICLTLTNRVARLEERADALADAGTAVDRGPSTSDEAPRERARRPDPAASPRQGPDDVGPGEEGRPRDDARAGGPREPMRPLEALVAEETRVREALTTYVQVAGFDAETSGALQDEIDRIFENKRAAMEAKVSGGDDPAAIHARMEAQRQASDAAFRRILGDDEALIFEEEVLGVRPRPAREPRDRGGGSQDAAGAGRG